MKNILLILVTLLSLQNVKAQQYISLTDKTEDVLHTKEYVSKYPDLFQNDIEKAEFIIYSKNNLSVYYRYLANTVMTTVIYSYKGKDEKKHFGLAYYKITDSGSYSLVGISAISDPSSLKDIEYYGIDKLAKNIICNLPDSKDIKCDTEPENVKFLALIKLDENDIALNCYLNEYSKVKYEHERAEGGDFIWAKPDLRESRVLIYQYHLPEWDEYYIGIFWFTKKDEYGSQSIIDRSIEAMIITE